MATVVNTTPSNGGEGNGFGLLAAVILLIAFVFLLFYFGIPALNAARNSGGNAPTVTVPDQIDVNVNNPQQ